MRKFKCPCHRESEKYPFVAFFPGARHNLSVFPKLSSILGGAGIHDTRSDPTRGRSESSSEIVMAKRGPFSDPIWIYSRRFDDIPGISSH